MKPVEEIDVALEMISAIVAGSHVILALLARLKKWLEQHPRGTNRQDHGSRVHTCTVATRPADREVRRTHPSVRDDPIGGPSGGHAARRATACRCLTTRPESCRGGLVPVAESVNYAGLLPELARVDLIRGRVTGPGEDRDALYAPDTRVIHSWDTAGRSGSVTLTRSFVAEHDGYVRLRGTDGKRSQPGYLGADVDPAGPAQDVPGAVNPWDDLWFYTNPIFLKVR